MPKELITAIESLWQAAMEHAQNQLTEYKKSLETEHDTTIKLHQEAEKVVAEFSRKITETSSKLEQEVIEKQKLNIELALISDRLAEQQKAFTVQKEQYEERLKRIYEEKDQVTSQCCQQQNELKILQEKLELQAKQQQNLIMSQNKSHEQSENRWLKLIDNAREETKDSNKKLTQLQRNYEDQLEKLKAKLLELQLSEHEKNTQLKLSIEQNNQLKQQYKILKEEYIKIKATLTKLKADTKLKKGNYLAKGKTKKSSYHIENF